MKKHLTFIVILSFTLTAFGCSSNDHNEAPPPQPPPEEITEIQGSFESKFRRYAQQEKHTGQDNASQVITLWRDTVWRNERVHTQLVLWAEKDLENISYQINDLKYTGQSIPASNIRLRFPSYVLGDTKALDCGMQTSRQSAYIADALSETQVTRITSSDPVKIWITIDIPKGTLPGLYKGSIDVKQNVETSRSFNIELLVTNNTLPDVKDWAFHLDIWQFPFQLTSLCAKNGVQIEPFSSEYETLMSSFYKMLADAGQKAITTYIKDGAFQNGETMVNWTLNADNTWNFDYTNFDKFVEFMLSLGINKQINCFSIIGWQNTIGYYDAASSNYKNRRIEIGTNEYNEVWTAFLSSFRTHLTRKGWFDKTVLYLDETTNEETRKAIDLIKQNGTDWKIGLAGSRITADIESELYDYSILLGYDRTSRSELSTFYTSCSQTIPNNYISKETSPAEMVWMAWYAASKGLDGYLRWAYDYWQNTNPSNMQDGTNTAGDFHMIYRTNNTASSKAVASIRFELLREGIQDYEKIRILSNTPVNTHLNRIDETSGVNAEKMIKEGQRLIKLASSH